jgi:putative transposase
VLYAWCLMTNHIHLIVVVGRKGEEIIEATIRDFKKFTSVHVVRAIENNPNEMDAEYIQDSSSE